MQLATAVKQAKTPEDLAKILEEIGRRYMVARTEESKFSSTKAEIRDACMSALARLETDQHEWEADGNWFRAQKYPVVKVLPSMALVRLLSARGLDDCYEVLYSINEKAIDLAVKRGQVSIEEIRELSELRRTEAFRIDKIKDPKLGAEAE